MWLLRSQPLGLGVCRVRLHDNLKRFTVFNSELGATRRFELA